MTGPKEVGAQGLTRIELEGLDWATLLQSGEATEGDLIRFNQWRALSPEHAASFAAAAQLRKLAKTQRFPGSEQFPPGFWERPATRRGLLGGAVVGIATYATLQPPLAMWPSLAELTSDFRTGTGQRRTVQIAQGVSVELNTRTSVSLTARSGQPGIELVSGEVAADVAMPGSQQFQAIAASCQVSAQRASFDLVNTDRQVAVTCLSGSLIATAGQTKLTLGPGQRAYLDDGKLRQSGAVSTLQATAWRRGKLEYRHAPLADIVSDINRYRPGKIVITSSDLAARRYTAAFTIDQIGDVVADLQRLTHANARSVGGLVLLS